MAAAIPLVIDGVEPIEGSHPVIIIGPNGAGKTKLGLQLAAKHTARWISALRQLTVNLELPMLTVTKAEFEVRNSINNGRANPWSPSPEINALLAKFKAEDTQSAIEYRDQALKEAAGKPPETKLTRLVEFWNHHFPGRSIDLSSYHPTASSCLSSTDGGRTTFQIARMSDGERVALYLAASILDAPAGLIIIDEPELHLHPVLARVLWSAFEDMRSDSRFVYITHDLTFASSRRQPQFVIVKPGAPPELLPRENRIPDEILDSILGAASFSVVAERIVFCESAQGGDRDESLYRAWFSEQDTAVIAAGGSSKVQQCVAVFNSGEAVRGGKAIGIIDRDYWPETYLGQIISQVHVLKVHEVENLLFLPTVFTAIGKYLQIPEELISEKYTNFLMKARKYFHGAALNKQILERVKRRVEFAVLSNLNSVHVGADRHAMRTSLIRALQPEHWTLDPTVIFAGEERDSEIALNGSVEDFLRYFPGKSFFAHAAHELGLTPERYLGLIVAALKNQSTEKDSPMAQLHAELDTALSEYLPPRRRPGADDA